MPADPHEHWGLCILCKLVGGREGGTITLRPDFAMAVHRDYTNWWDSKRVEHLIEGLRKAGLEIPDQQ